MALCSVMSNSFAWPTWDAVLQAPLSVAFARQEYCSGLEFATPGHFPHSEIESASLASSCFSCISRQILYHQRHLGSPTSVIARETSYRIEEINHSVSVSYYSDIFNITYLFNLMLEKNSKICFNLLIFSRQRIVQGPAVQGLDHLLTLLSHNKFRRLRVGFLLSSMLYGLSRHWTTRKATQLRSKLFSVQ